MEPSAAPAPTTVCSSSMNRMISPWDSCTSLSTALSRSSNSPRYFAPAISAPISKAISFLFFRLSGTSPLTMRCAKPFDNGGFADAGIADQHGIVFAAPGEHLDHAANLFVAADHRVELALGGELGEVAAVLAESFVGRFGILRRHPLVAADIFERAGQFFAREAKLLEKASSRAAVVGHRQQQMLYGDVFVFDFFSFFFGLCEQAIQTRR